MASARAFTRLAPDARRRQILGAANTLFASGGYDGVSLEDIAQAASVTRGLVHHYFGGKRDIYLLLIEKAGEGAISAFGNPPPGSAKERVHHTVRGWLDWVDGNQAIWAVTAGVFGDISDPDITAVVEAQRVAALDRLIENFGDIVEDGQRIRYALDSWTGLNRVACRRWIDGHVSREQAHDLLTATLLYVLRTYGDRAAG